MTSTISESRSMPALKIFSRYRGSSPDLEGPYVSIGNCLEPWLADGGLVWLDRGLPARPGDLVMIDHDGQVRTKHLEQLSDGSWWLISNVMGIPLLHRWRILGVIVVAFNPPSKWLHQYPEHQAFINQQNAEVK